MRVIFNEGIECTVECVVIPIVGLYSIYMIPVTLQCPGKH